MFPVGKKSRRRRRPKRKTASYFGERLDNQRRVEEEVEISAAVEDQAKTQFEEVRRAIEDETEAFVWNIPYSVTAPALVKFIEGQIASTVALSSSNGGPGVVRCNILVKDNRSRGSAVVLFKNKNLFNYFLQKSKVPGLILDSRRIQVKEGDGSSKHKRNRGYTSRNSFTASSFHIGYPPLDDGDCRGPFVSSWQHPGQGGDDVKECGDMKLTINGSSRSLTLTFHLNNILYRVEHSMTNVRGLCLERANEDDQRNESSSQAPLVVAFWVTEAPRIFLEETSKKKAQSQAAKNDCEEASLGSSSVSHLGINLENILSGMTMDPFLWELDLMGLLMLNERWQRTTDPTTANLFGRCFSYRVIVTGDESGSSRPADLRRTLAADLKAFLLLRQKKGGAGKSPEKRSSTTFEVDVKPARKVEPPAEPPQCRPMAEESFFSALKCATNANGRQLSFRVLYALHCLVGTNKVNLEDALDDDNVASVVGIRRNNPSRTHTAWADGALSEGCSAGMAARTGCGLVDAVLSAGGSDRKAVDVLFHLMRDNKVPFIADLKAEFNYEEIFESFEKHSESARGDDIAAVGKAAAEAGVTVEPIADDVGSDAVAAVETITKAVAGLLSEAATKAESGVNGRVKQEGNSGDYEDDTDDEERFYGKYDDYDDYYNDEIGPTVLIRRVLVTPTRICPQPPELEPSNRVIRQFSKHLDRFLRVTFVDENFGSFHQVSNSEDIIENRLRVIINDGISIAGQKYKLLAFSNSQIREQSCWFYDETKRTSDISAPPTAEHIRSWIGDLSSIRVVGKHAARLGQGFSSTVPAFVVDKRNYKIIEDVQRNGFCFSDGVGMISQTDAADIARLMRLALVPSAFQIRFGGGKGMLTVMPDEFIPQGHKIAFRPSMMKFESTHRELEINSYSRVMPFYLNRQLIFILTSRGVQERAILNLLNNMTRELDAALYDDKAALSLLYRYGRVGYEDGDIFVPLGAAFHMLLSGMRVRKEPYIYGIVAAVRRRLLLEIQTKARIIVPGGVCLLGVMDETGTLKPGEVFIQLSPEASTGRPEGMRRRPEGVLLFTRVGVGRSPTLHPGDLRVLAPRDVPALHHLCDVIVFPSQGSRPHPNEMGGGDLDGDIYFVFWDEDLLPKTEFEPMDYTASSLPPVETKSPTGVVTIQEIGNFFVDYIKNDKLGMIANAWMVYADIDRADCSQCLQLAQLHSTAVDFAKSGVPAEFPLSLRTKKCPSFMENNFKEQYESNTVVGKIYRRCKEMARDTRIGGTAVPCMKVDKSLLIEGCEEYFQEATALMDYYNERLWEIMQQFGVYDEMEALSGFTSQFSRRVSQNGSNGGRGKDDVQARLNKNVKQLKEEFVGRFLEGLLLRQEETLPTTAARGDDEERAPPSSSSGDARSTVAGDSYFVDRDGNRYDMDRAMKRASAWYYCTYSQDYGCYTDVHPLVSFPWIAFYFLCRIKELQWK